MKLKAHYLEIFLFVAVIGICALKFSGLFVYGNTLLPGWDTVPHFYLFENFLKLLSGGHINGYDVQQLGGSTLFYFYGPLPYFIGAVIKFIGGGMISDLFAFRLLFFLVIIAFAFTFWFFVRTFVNKSVGWLALVLSLFYIFYPTIFRGFGIGAPAVLLGGLFTSSLGIMFSLLFFACLEKLRETGKRLYIILSILCFVAVPLSSPMVTIFLMFLWAIYALRTWRKKNWVYTQGSLFLYGCLISLFFIVPIILFGFYESAKPQIMDAVPFLTALVTPFVSLLAQYKNTIVPFASVWNTFLFVASLVIFIFFVRGFLAARKNETHLALRDMFLGVTFFQIFCSVTANVFPFITVHYYRSSPFVLLFYFALALLGIYEALREKRIWIFSSRWVYILLIVLMFGIGGWVLGMRFDRNPTFITPLLNRDENVTLSPYHFTLENYSGYPVAKQVVDRVLQEKTQRIFVEGDMYQENELGSPHVIFTLLNLAGRSTLNGLLFESAHQSDYLLPVSHGVSHSLLWGFSDDSLIYNFNLITQFKENIDRLRLFGVDYIVVHSVDAIERLGLFGDQIEEVARFGEEKKFVPPGFQYALLQYRIYRFKNPIPLVRESEYPFGLFVDTSLSNQKKFKELTTELFKRPDLYNMQVAFTKNISDVSRQELKGFDYFLVTPASADDQNLMKSLRYAGKPIISFPRFDDNVYSSLIAMKKEKKQAVSMAPIQILNEKTIQFATSAETSTPWIINFGNFPNWHVDGRTIFEVTPGQMLVVSSGSGIVTMKFRPGTVEYVVRWISLLALLCLPVFAVFLRRKFLGNPQFEGVKKKLKNIFADLHARSETISRLFLFLWRNKLWWLIPIVFILIVFSLVLIFAQSSPLGPFIYTLF